MKAKAGSRGRIRTHVWFVSSAFTLDHPPGSPPQPRLPGSLHSPSGRCASGKSFVSTGLGTSCKCSGWGKGVPPPHQVSDGGVETVGEPPGTPNWAEAWRGYPGGHLGDSSQATMTIWDLLLYPGSCLVDCPETPIVPIPLLLLLAGDFSDQALARGRVPGWPGAELPLLTEA